MRVLSSNRSGRRSIRNNSQTSGHSSMQRLRWMARSSPEAVGMRRAHSPSVTPSTASRPPVAAIRGAGNPAFFSSRSSANGV